MIVEIKENLDSKISYKMIIYFLASKECVQALERGKIDLMVNGHHSMYYKVPSRLG